MATAWGPSTTMTSPPSPRPDRPSKTWPSVAGPAGRRGRTLSGKGGRTRSGKGGRTRCGLFWKKLSGRRGFSLAETLFCVMILSLSAGTLVSTITIATRQFEARTRESEQVFLCHTLTTAVQDQLTYVNKNDIDTVKVVLNDDKSLKEFNSGAVGGMSRKSMFHFAIDDGENQWPCPTDKWGEIVIPVGESVYRLTDSANYAVKRGTRQVQLEANLEVAAVDADDTDDYFLVTVRVRSKTDGTDPVVNQFTVTPIHPDALSSAFP